MIPLRRWLRDQAPPEGWLGLNLVQWIVLAIGAVLLWIAQP